MLVTGAAFAELVEPECSGTEWQQALWCQSNARRSW